MARDVKDSIKSIITSYRQVRADGTGRAVQYDRQKLRTELGSKLLVDWDSEVALFEQTLDNVAKVLESRGKYLSAVDTLVSLGSEDLPDDLRREAESERRKGALSERGRRPAEVAALYGYSRSSAVTRLRERHRLDPQTGYPLPGPLTSRKLPEEAS